MLFSQFVILSERSVFSSSVVDPETSKVHNKYILFITSATKYQ